MGLSPFYCNGNACLESELPLHFQLTAGGWAQGGLLPCPAGLRVHRAEDPGHDLATRNLVAGRGWVPGSCSRCARAAA